MVVLLLVLSVPKRAEWVVEEGQFQILAVLLRCPDMLEEVCQGVLIDHNQLHV